jgi:hypothetical protein
MAKDKNIPTSCPICGKTHVSINYRYPGIATMQGVEVKVTVEERACYEHGDRYVNRDDHDWRVEARQKLNKKFGNEPGTHITGIKMTKA